MILDIALAEQDPQGLDKVLAIALSLNLRQVIWTPYDRHTLFVNRGIEMLSRTAHNIKICLPELGLERY